MRRGSWLGLQFALECPSDELLNRNAVNARDLLSFAVNGFRQFDRGSRQPPLSYDTVFCANRAESGFHSHIVSPIRHLPHVDML